MKQEINEKLEKLSQMVSKWFSIITRLLNKEVTAISGADDIFESAFKATQEYLGDAMKGGSPNTLASVFSGLSALSRGDIQGIKSLALLLGGFPEETQRLE
jgi:hypothetical protein